VGGPEIAAACGARKWTGHTIGVSSLPKTWDRHILAFEVEWEVVCNLLNGTIFDDHGWP